MPAKTGITFAVVAASGGHYTTVQLAHDAGERSIFVKAGFSGAGFGFLPDFAGGLGICIAGRALAPDASKEVARLKGAVLLAAIWSCF